MKLVILASAAALVVSGCANIYGGAGSKNWTSAMMDPEPEMEMEEEVMEVAEETPASYCVDQGGSVVDRSFMYGGDEEMSTCRMDDGWEMELNDFYAYRAGRLIEDAQYADGRTGVVTSGEVIMMEAEAEAQ